MSEHALFALEENCSLKSVRFVSDGKKLLLLLSRGEVVLEFKLNIHDPGFKETEDNCVNARF